MHFLPKFDTPRLASLVTPLKRGFNRNGLKMLFLVFLSLFVFSISLIAISHIRADDDLDEELEDVEDEIEETQGEINELNEKVNNIKNEVNNLSGSLSEVLATINSLQAEISEISQRISKVNIDLNKNTVLLTSKTVLRDRTLRSFYKKSPTNYMVSVIQSNGMFANDNTSEYLKKYIDESVTIISEINSDIIINKENKKRLEEIKKELEVEQQKLVVIKADTEKKLAAQQAELAAKNNDLSGLNAKLDGLLAKQQEILSAKSGNFNASLGEGVQTDDPNASPNFNPGFSPAFAAFSYGAYTHYNGMSQWGAKGRAEDGQDYEEILEFYFKGKEVTDDYDTPDKVRVVGDGLSCDGEEKYYNEEVDFETYIKRIYEVYDHWPKEVLKAQAVLARTYAIRILDVHGQIQPNQNHQVYKNCNKGGNWEEAVEDTEGTVLVKDGQINFLAEYSSTTGGYINGVGWDAKDGKWPNEAYEKRAGAYWFYKAWYTQGTNTKSAKCGRSHPWLDGEEMADVLNAYVVLKHGGDTSGISPLTTDCWGGDPWSMSKLREKAESADKGFSKVIGVSDFSFSNDGKTASFTFQTDKGSYKVSDAQTFKSAFNLRAPGYIAIKSRLFDLRKK